MKRTLLASAIILAAAAVVPLGAQTGATRSYQQMSPSEQTAFVSDQAKGIARQISGVDYEFTPAFDVEIQKFVDKYARRVRNNGGDRLGKGDARFAFDRGRVLAPNLIAAFKARNVSPLIGLYLPMIESEYVNVPNPNAMGAVGMFQFLPATGKRYGLSPEDLLSVEKSADAAARYISGSIATFADDPMKEALALLSYNRGVNNTQRDLELILDKENRQCSICALTAARAKLDQSFQNESVYYVPLFFAAAIVGENPQAFGLQMQPLSTFERK